MPSPRFSQDFTLVGDVTVTPGDDLVTVGSFSLGAGEDTLWVEVQQLGSAGPWPFSYGILGWRTSVGYELGTQKVWPQPTVTPYKLSIGLPPTDQEGQLVFSPRSYNLQWVQAGTPWSLRFFARSGQSSSQAAAVVGNSLASSSDGRSLRFVQVDFGGTP